MMVKFGILAPLVRPSLIIDGFVLLSFKKIERLADESPVSAAFLELRMILSINI